MCGIAGWIDLKNNLHGQEKILEQMSQALSHRGPDAEGLWTSDHALIAHKRLIVVDPAGGCQPMVRRFGGYDYTITYNGELYNTVELREELKAKGYIFESNSDTEVLLISYIEWGSGCAERLNGIYAFGIWNEKEQSLFLCRDRFGVKPLFYALRGSSLIFASELKALLAHPEIQPEIDNEGLAEIFALGPSRTPGHGVFKNVYEVKPSHHILYNHQGLRMTRYWKLESHPHTDSLENTITNVRNLLTDSIVRQLVSDVPVCTFLSGGLDSSIITAVAAQEFRDTGKGRLHSFSIDYTGNDQFFIPSSFQPDADAPWVKRMSDVAGTEHHYITFNSQEIADALKDALYSRDLPGMADIDSSLWLFSREVKKHSTVALSGECSDEIFGGYPWFHREEMFSRDSFPWIHPSDVRSTLLKPEVKDYIKPHEYVERRYQETISEVPVLKGEDPTEARRREIFYLNITWFMSTLLDRKDRMSMASGLEVRVPFCDHRLVQYVWNIPWDIKTYGDREKGLLRQAAKGILPDDVIKRRKSPYPKTHDPYFEKIVNEMLIEILNDSASPLLRLIQKDKVLPLLNGKSDYGRPWFGQLMAGPQLAAYLIQIDLWMRSFKISIV